MAGLKYLGENPDNEWLAGVPARDLTEEDEAEYGLDFAELVQSGLYELQPFIFPAKLEAKSDAKEEAKVEGVSDAHN